VEADNGIEDESDGILSAIKRFFGLS